MDHSWLSTDPEVRATFETDASGLHIVPDAVARPTTAAEIVELLREANTNKTSVTAAGGQTSTTAASISERGVVLSLRGMTKILDVDRAARTIRVEPGALVADVKRQAAHDGLLFAPDPTSEEECTIGGAIACNASGARTFKYGATRAHVRALRVALANGDIAELRRSDLEKNTVGYAFAHDPIDWFIGSEGTLGVILDAELSLLTLPAAVIGLAVPFSSEAAALQFVVAAREARTVTPRCIEYFDRLALEIARSADDQPSWAAGATGMVYIEQELADEGALDSALEGWLAVAESCGALDDLRVFQSESELRHVRRMRHAVPATMNERGARCRADGGRKVSTDWAVPYRMLHEAITMARNIATERGVEQAVIYGHAGNGHPHQNFLARNADELARIEGVIEATLRRVIAMHGTVAAEHGIGKLKRKWLPLQMSPLQIGMMHAVKRELDPNGILAPGNIL